MPSEVVEKYLDFVSMPAWTSRSVYNRNINTTEDKGKTWKPEDHAFIYSADFYPSQDTVDTVLSLSNISDVLAKLYGVVSILILFISAVPSYINRK